MATFPTAPAIAPYWDHAFDLKAHLQGFLKLDAETLEQRLAQGTAELAKLGHRDFDWAKAEEFYQDQVGEAYLFDLGAWHLTSRDYIGDTLRLIADFAEGEVLDFGGGIGTHAIGAASCPQVERVTYCDLNPVSLEFVQYRAQQLELSAKLHCCRDLPADPCFDAIICFDVLEHLPDPVAQLRQFRRWLKPEGVLITNWYFFKGVEQEFPFHLDDPAIVGEFFRVLQSQFLEVFHPYFITARCYRPWIE
ncbi:MAG: class I SAM-dependent methyltransferase [Prochlorothrix sp.]|nr:class I SAM-dependent methyltransferase [Prochlorothrix sp.]